MRELDISEVTSSITESVVADIRHLSCWYDDVVISVAAGEFMPDISISFNVGDTRGRSSYMRAIDMAIAARRVYKAFDILAPSAFVEKHIKAGRNVFYAKNGKFYSLDKSESDELYAIA